MNTMELFTAIGTYGITLLAGGFATYAYMAYKRDRDELYRTISDQDSYQQRGNEDMREDFRRAIDLTAQDLQTKLDDIARMLESEVGTLGNRIDDVCSRLENIED